MKLFKRSIGLAIIAAAVMFVSKSAQASDYSVAVSSADPTSSAGNYSANQNVGPLSISGNVRVRQFTISNFSGAVTQIVSIYDTCTASHTATARFKVPVAASSTYTSAVYPADSFVLASPCVAKSDANSSVYFNLIGQ